jgi:RsiW-degrading membrane proteinase PrsW (M82 family)
MPFIAFLLSLLPLPPLVLYFSRGQRRVLATELFWTAAGFGFLAAMPIAVVEQVLSKLFADSTSLDSYAAMTAFLIAAIPEELGKYIILVGFVLGHADFERPQDAFLFGLAVSLGFATIENVSYVAMASQWTVVALTRAVSAVPVHATTGAVMGAFASRALVYDDRAGLLYGLAFVVPALLHGCYDFAVMTVAYGFEGQHGAPSFPLWIYVLLMVATFTMTGIVAANASRLVPSEHQAARLSRAVMR